MKKRSAACAALQTFGSGCRANRVGVMTECAQSCDKTLRQILVEFDTSTFDRCLDQRQIFQGGSGGKRDHGADVFLR